AIRGDVTGVFASEVAKPLKGAIVILTGQHLQLVTETSGTGAFNFDGLTPGVYRLTAKHLGFGNSSLTNKYDTRLIEVRSDGTSQPADDLEGEPSKVASLTLARQYAGQNREEVLAIVSQRYTSPSVRLYSVVKPPVDNWLWEVRLRNTG